MTGATRKLIEVYEYALGPSVATPPWIAGGDGQRVRAPFRVFRWRCPSCGGGDGDAIWRPLVITSDGTVRCEARGCSIELISACIRDLTDTQRLLDSIGIAV